MCNKLRLRLRLLHIGLGLPAAIFRLSAQLRTLSVLPPIIPFKPSPLHLVGSFVSYRFRPPLLNESFSGFIRLFVHMHNPSVPPFEGIKALYCICI